jgi:hypothetical protein
MSRLDVKGPRATEGDCPVSIVCPRHGDHSHLRCDECGALDFTGACQTCITLRGVQVVGMAYGWQEKAS